MDKKKPDSKSVQNSKADMLRTAVSKPKGKCDDCAASEKDQTPVPPMMAGLLAKLGLLGLPGMAGGCPHAHGLVVIAKKDPAAPEKAPSTNEPSGEKKVLEKTKTESSSPFIQRCVAAMTGQTVRQTEAHEPKETKSKFAKALEAIKKRNNREF